MLDVVSSENREKTLRFVLTFYRQATDRLPTHYQQSADCRPTGSLYFGQNLSAVCRPTVGWQTADSRPTVSRQTTNCRPTVDRQLTNNRPTGFLGSSSSQLPLLLVDRILWFFKSSTCTSKYAKHHFELVRAIVNSSLKPIRWGKSSLRKHLKIWT